MFKQRRNFGLLFTEKKPRLKKTASQKERDKTQKAKEREEKKQKKKEGLCQTVTCCILFAYTWSVGILVGFSVICSVCVYICV